MHATLPLESSEEERIVREVLQAHAGEPGPLLEILHGVQNALGYVPHESIATIADGLNLSRAEVYGVVTFYRFFRRAPPGRHIIRICRAEACQAMHGDALAAHARSTLGVGFDESRADRAATLESVYCLGNCACAPAIMIDGDLHGRVTPERFDELVAPMLEKPGARSAS